MSQIPGPRTSPTVKPVPTMNKKNLRSWELRLGLLQVVILLGVVTGSMACVFYLGFFSGHRVGFDSAMETSLASAPRIPVEGVTSATPDVTEEQSTRIFAKLQEDQGKEDVVEADQKLPELAAIAEQPAVTAETPQATAEPVADTTASAVLDSGAKIEVIHDTAKVAETSTTLQDALKEAHADKPVITVKPEAKQVVKEVPVVKPTPLEKVAPTPAPKPEIAFNKVVKPGWYAQVAAPKKKLDAENLFSRLRGSGFAVAIEVASVRGDEYFRVLVGPESNREQAERLLGQLKRESYLSGEPFIRLVK